MVQFKGRSQLKKYNTQKLKKWGYKLYLLTRPKGQIYNLEVHTGAIETCPGQPDLEASGKIVMHLLLCIPQNNWHKLFINNWYTRIPLATTIMEQGKRLWSKVLV